jgi:hypothetical protein
MVEVSTSPGPKTKLFICWL